MSARIPIIRILQKKSSLDYTANITRGNTRIQHDCNTIALCIPISLHLSLSLSLISERCSGSPVISPVVLEKTTKDRKSGRIPLRQEQRQPRGKPQIPYHETSCCQTVEPMHKNTNSANKARCVIGLVGFRPDRSWQSLHFTRKERT